MSDTWDSLNLGQRVVRAAWMAVREHLHAEHPLASIDPAAPLAGDQADGLRRWVALERIGRLQPDRADGGAEA